MILVDFHAKPFNFTVIQVYAPTTNAQVEGFNDNLQDLLELTAKTNKQKSPFHIGDWNAKIGSREIPGITGKFGLEVQNEAGQHIGHNKHFFQHNKK